MKLIVGLGNPGILYRNSRHNVGSRVVKELAARYGITLKRNSVTYSMKATGTHKDERFVLAQPLTFMNLSGRSVKALFKKYAVDLEELLVVCDDMDLDLGTLRIRPAGSSGGHKGLQSIIDALASKDFPRLRIGIGRPYPGKDARDFVLEPFKGEKRVAFEEAVRQALECCQVWLTAGITQAMNKFNAKGLKK